MPVVFYFCDSKKICPDPRLLLDSPNPTSLKELSACWAKRMWCWWSKDLTRQRNQSFGRYPRTLLLRNNPDLPYFYDGSGCAFVDVSENRMEPCYIAEKRI
jgi:hypothetical protein